MHEFPEAKRSLNEMLHSNFVHTDALVTLNKEYRTDHKNMFKNISMNDWMPKYTLTLESFYSLYKEERDMVKLLILCQLVYLLDKMSEAKASHEPLPAPDDNHKWDVDYLRLLLQLYYKFEPNMNQAIFSPMYQCDPWDFLGRLEDIFPGVITTPLRVSYSEMRTCVNCKQTKHTKEFLQCMPSNIHK